MIVNLCLRMFFFLYFAQICVVTSCEMRMRYVSVNLYYTEKERGGGGGSVCVFVKY